MSQNETPDIPPDPILHKSLSVHIALAALAVVAAVALAIYDEAWGRRPYKAYQVEFAEKYADYLESLAQRQGGVEAILRGLKDFQALEADLATATEASELARKDIQTRIANMTAQITALTAAIKSPNSEIAAARYKAEIAAHHDGVEDVSDAPSAKPLLEELDRILARQVPYSWEEADASGAKSTKSETRTVAELRVAMPLMQRAKGGLQKELGAASEEMGAATHRRDEWIKSNMGEVAAFLDNSEGAQGAAAAERQRVAEMVRQVGAARYLDEYRTAFSTASVTGMAEASRDSVLSLPGIGVVPVLAGEIKEIHIREANSWVDRCETCHLGIRSEVPITDQDVRGEPGHERLFISHPRMELLESHDPERFGCSTCHNGNGVAITDTEHAHGLNKHWLHPLHPSQNTEAGCVKCHEDDLVLDMGERISNGRRVFMRHGCFGCHKRQGYDVEEDQLQQVAKGMREAETEIARKEQRRRNLIAALQPVYDVDESRFIELEPENRRLREALTVEIAQLKTEHQALALQKAELELQRKKVGPELGHARAKLRPEWLTQWIRNPKGWRHETKMPTYRWNEVFDGSTENADEVVKDIAAFIWQSAKDVHLPPQTAGDVAKGKELFEAVGCLGCHSMGEGEDRIGGDYAANLSNLGEKAKLDYITAWVKDPRALNPSTTMPNLRLTDAESLDIAAYLLSQKRDGQVQDAAPWLTEDARFERGERFVKHFGCAGCHRIPGLEEEGRIGTELTKHGSRPKERLDFGHFTVGAQRGTHEPLLDWEASLDGVKAFAGEGDAKWYSHRGFFKHKIAEPGLFDRGKHLPDWTNRLRMPRFNFSARDLEDVVTFMMGSTDTDEVPETFKYRPDDLGLAIQRGWPVVKRYNCQGCHEVVPGDVPDLWRVPSFAQKEGAHYGDRPPSLVSTGFRTQPQWLAHFLHDPSLGGGREDPKGLRPHLSVRMPTFEFTEAEVETLVRFLDAMAKQPAYYQKPRLLPLDRAEDQMARGMFKLAACAQCHVVEGVPLSSETKAPNLSLSRDRLRPEWMRRWFDKPAAMQPGTAMPEWFDWNAEQGRYVFKNVAGVPDLAAYEGDHLELMVRYLNDANFEK